MTRLIVLLVVAACSSPTPEPIATREQLLDPEECASCHPNQYIEWSGSMHAYAAEDPLFIALNKRGQRETNGALGDFCVKCHAPMAVRMGLTTDGLNLDSIESKLKGVTCYFCHTAAEVNGTHNNPIELSDDDVMLGRYSDPVASGFHKAGASDLLDGRALQSGDMCGSCHDIVLDNGVHIERTYAEWKNSLFNAPVEEGGQTCANCHMKPSPGAIADFDGAKENRVNHDHRMHGVDVAVTEWPQKAAQLAGIAEDLYVSVDPQLCVNPGAGGVELDVTLKNVFAGHRIPSGSGFERRMWLEIVAKDSDGNVVFSSGVVGEQQSVKDAAATDSQLWQIRDFARKSDGSEAHFFWEVATVEDRLLPEPVDPTIPHALTRRFINVGNPATVSMIVHIRQVPLELLDDLIASGDLDPALKANYPTQTLTATELNWSMLDNGLGCICRQGDC